MTVATGSWPRLAKFLAWAEDNGLEVAPTLRPEMVWVDVESTGLDYNEDPILELGLVLTDRLGRVIMDGARSWLVFDAESYWYNRAISKMPEVVAQMHLDSGLSNDIAEATRHREASRLMKPTFVEKEAREWLANIAGEKPGIFPMAGSTVGSLDRPMLRTQMPDLTAWFHYRNEDISSVREFARRLNWPVVQNQPEAKKAHRVLEDCADSIKLYRYFIEHFFITDDPQGIFNG